MILSLAGFSEQLPNTPLDQLAATVQGTKEFMAQDTVNALLVKELFASIAEQGCMLAPIRFKPLDDQALFDGDYDFVIAPSSVSEALRVTREVLTRHGIDFAIYRRKFGKIRLAILSDDKSKQLVVEFWRELETRNLPGAYPAVSWESLEPYIESDPDSLTGYRIAPDIEAAYYLCHLLEKNKQVDQGMVPIRLRLYRELGALSDEIATLVASIKTNADIAVAAFSARDYLARKNIILRKKGVLAALYTIGNRLPYTLFKLRLSMAGSHRFIDFIGPDGVGKTSLIEAAAGKTFPSGKYFRFKKTYRKSISYSIAHPILKRIYQARHQEKLAKNQIDDMSSGLLFYISIVGIFWRNLVCLLIGRLYLSDRSPADLLVTGYRFNDKNIAMRPSAIRDIRFMPTSRAVVHLHAPVETITARKQEMNEQQINQYQASIFNVYLIKAPPTYICINTDCSIEQSMLALNKLINKNSVGQ